MICDMRLCCLFWFLIPQSHHFSFTCCSYSLSFPLAEPAVKVKEILSVCVCVSACKMYICASMLCDMLLLSQSRLTYFPDLLLLFHLQFWCSQTYALINVCLNLFIIRCHVGLRTDLWSYLDKKSNYIGPNKYLNS